MTPTSLHFPASSAKNENARELGDYVAHDCVQIRIGDPMMACPIIHPCQRSREPATRPDLDDAFAKLWISFVTFYRRNRRRANFQSWFKRLGTFEALQARPVEPFRASFLSEKQEETHLEEATRSSRSPTTDARARSSFRIFNQFHPSERKKWAAVICQNVLQQG